MRNNHEVGRSGVSQAKEEYSMHSVVSGEFSLVRLCGRSRFLIAVLTALACGASTKAQVRVTLSDFFTKTNLYYRAYANKYDPSDTSGSTAFAVPAGLAGTEGPNQFWDFSKGPTNEVLRFDYLSPVGMPEAADFPDAKLVEQETLEGSGSAPVSLFFDAIPGVGRKVYGYYADLSSNPMFGLLGFALSPSTVFVPPIVDFPDPISYAAEWSTSMTYENDLTADSGGDPTGEDPGGGFSARQQITQQSSFKVDAYGTIVLPDELGGNFGEGLRIAEDVTIDVSYDLGLGDGLQHYETDYTRNYYWVMPGYGIVAQLNSVQSSSPPGTNVTRAVAFMRMFETNKKITTGGGGGGCTDPAPVNDMRIRVSNGSVLLTWSKADCATQYQVQYTDTPAEPTSWKPLGTATASLSWVGEKVPTGAGTRFYRIVSLK